MQRRHFLVSAASAGSLSLLNTELSFAITPSNQAANISVNPAFTNIELPKLPWDINALDPVISSNLMGFHYGKHHKSYYDNLAKLLPNTPFAALKLPEIVKTSIDNKAIFNNAAQAWNHTFFWYSLAPKSGGKPSQALNERLEQDFGGYDKFKAEFVNACTSQFGSGWAWLVLDKTKKKLMITKTSNADTPLTNPNLVPLAVVDVWEHAYYLDYQNRRADYANAILDKLLNWHFVEENLLSI